MSLSPISAVHTPTVSQASNVAAKIPTPQPAAPTTPTDSVTISKAGHAAADGDGDGS